MSWYVVLDNCRLLRLEDHWLLHRDLQVVVEATLVDQSHVLLLLVDERIASLLLHVVRIQIIFSCSSAWTALVAVSFYAVAVTVLRRATGKLRSSLRVGLRLHLCWLACNLVLSFGVLSDEFLLSRFACLYLWLVGHALLWPFTSLNHNFFRFTAGTVVLQVIITTVAIVAARVQNLMDLIWYRVTGLLVLIDLFLSRCDVSLTFQYTIFNFIWGVASRKNIALIII